MKAPRRPRLYTRYQPDQVAYLKQYYAQFTNAELARRYGLKWRAENGVPKWRPPASQRH